MTGSANSQVKQLNVFHKDMIVFGQKLSKIKIGHQRKFLQIPCEPFVDCGFRTSVLFKTFNAWGMMFAFSLVCVSKLYFMVELDVICLWLALLLRMCSFCVWISMRALLP